MNLEISKLRPRRYRDRIEPDLTGLIASIKEDGILSPLIVMLDAEGYYQIIAGQRRYEAALQIGLTEVPCVVKLSDELVDDLLREVIR